MRRRKGFTMIELAIVVVVATIMAAVVVPRWFRTLSRTRVESAATQVATCMRFARQLAITTRQNITVAVSSDSTALLVTDPGGNVMRRFSLPGGVKVRSTTGTPTFHARGTAFGVTVQVGDLSTTAQVVVNAVGRVRVQL